MWNQKASTEKKPRGEFDFFEEYDHVAFGQFLKNNDRALRGFFKEIYTSTDLGF